MTENKFTDAEIMADLQRCITRGLCSRCNHRKKYDNCVINLMKNVIDLVNRKQARIENLSVEVNKKVAEIETLTEKLNATIAGQETLQKALAEKDAEIEALKASENFVSSHSRFNALQNQLNEETKLREELLKTIKENSAEIERLKEYEDIRPSGCPNCHRGNFSNSKFCSHCGTRLQGKKKDVRAQVIKEFVKAFKVKFAKERYRDNYVVDDEMIDSLVKEMVGEAE